jgi:hypothetical protein
MLIFMDVNDNIKTCSRKSRQMPKADEEKMMTIKNCVKMAAALIPQVVLTTYSCINIVFTVYYIAGYTISTRFGNLGTQNMCN